MIIAVWRSLVAGRQAETAQQSMDTARQSLRNERYQQGAAMLGSEFLAVRLGGVYALSRLAVDYPEEYHLQAMEVLCAFARNPAPERQDEIEETEEPTERAPLPEDIQAVLTRVGHRGDEGRAIESAKFYWLDLHRADLARANLYAADLSGANLRRSNLALATLTAADLSEAWCTDADFHEADLTLANVSGARLGGANLSRVNLHNANVSGTVFAEERVSAGGSPPRLVPCVGLTQAQLDEARADPGHPPIIPPDLSDPETGARLGPVHVSWRVS